MAVYSTNWRTDYLSQSNGILNEGVLISCWVYTPAGDATDFGSVVTSSVTGTATTNNTRAVIGPSGSLAGRAFQRNTSNSYADATVSTYSADTWTHVCGAFLLDTNYGSYVNNSSGYNTGSAQVPGTTAFSRIGSDFNAGVGNANNSFAEYSAWNIAGLSEANIDALVSRLYTLNSGNIRNPQAINAETSQPYTGKLLNYWPLDNNTTGIEDVVSTADWVATGTVSTSAIAHPDVDTYSAVTLYPAMEPLYYGATLLADKTGIEYSVVEGHAVLGGEPVTYGSNGTTDGSGNFVWPGAGFAGSAADPVTVHLYWEEGTSPVLKHSLIYKTTLVEDV